MLVAPLLMALATRREVRRAVLTGGALPVIDAHYLFPDGVAAALIAKWLNLPLVLTARGSDVNLIAHHPIARRMILWAIRRSRATVTVSSALKSVLVSMGAEPGKLHVVRNGVDLVRFAPRERAAARQRLGLDTFTALTVGKLDENKGHHLVIEALGSVPGAKLVIVGEGPWRSELEGRVAALGLTERVRFAGVIGREELPDYYAAADALVFASAREGMPNVILEALACGLPVIATNAGGIGEILPQDGAGARLVERSAPAIAAALKSLSCSVIDRTAVRRHAEQFGWNGVSAALLALFAEVEAPCS
jgi:glycosyltransferase involved in cell wall biosynthesis